MSCGSLKRAASLLSEPTPPPIDSRNVPSFENLTIRLLPPRCPSDTQMSPFGATTTPDGPLKCRSSAPQTPASPRRITTSPRWFSLSTW